MVHNRNWFSRSGMMPVIFALTICVCVSGCRKKKYENPITKDTQQPDKVLFDKAIADIERGRYEIARITLNTLINTYDTSEFLAKSKLAIADSWYREGGSHGLAQAEAEYKDFILFYPTMEEAAESQNRICDIHYRQMEKADRDSTQALRAEAECRQLMTAFPNSKFAPIAEQKLRNIQEALGDGEMRVGSYYHHKGSHPAAANRFVGLVTQYPLYSAADEALWLEADSYNRMGTRFRKEAGDALTRIVRDYPLSGYVDDAKKKLQEMELPIPEADPAALARMKYEAENRTRKTMVGTSMGILKRGPDVRSAAKSGTPTMTQPKQAIPVSVPAPAAAVGTNDVSIQTVGDSSALQNNPDARKAVTGDAAAKPENAAAQTAPTPAPTQSGKVKKPKKSKKSVQTNVAPATPATNTIPGATGTQPGTAAAPPVTPKP